MSFRHLRSVINPTGFLCLSNAMIMIVPFLKAVTPLCCRRSPSPASPRPVICAYKSAALALLSVCMFNYRRQVTYWRSIRCSHDTDNIWHALPRGKDGGQRLLNQTESLYMFSCPQSITSTCSVIQLPSWLTYIVFDVSYVNNETTNDLRSL